MAWHRFLEPRQDEKGISLGGQLVKVSALERIGWPLHIVERREKAQGECQSPERGNVIEDNGYR